MERFRVLHFGYSGNLGGVEVFIKNIIMNSVIPCDIVVTTNNSVPFEDEIIASGSRVLRMQPRKKAPLSYKSNVKRLLREHPEYKAVHVHLNTASSIEPVIAAKELGVKCIVHSHSSNANWGKLTRMLHKINKKKLESVVGNKLACSKQAGEFMFKGSFEIVKNGIKTETFTYNEGFRRDIREEFNIGENEFVILHAGMFSPVKNQGFLLECFKKLLEKKPDSRLILVGEGENKNNICAKSKEMGIGERVIFAGKRYDINRFYSAADVFVLPSLFEGLPLTLIEASASGLGCVASDTVSSEAKVLEHIKFIPLAQGAEKWSDEILSSWNINRYGADKAVRKAGFDIAQTVNQIEEIYRG